MSTHRITYTTPKGDIKNNILIEAESREEAEKEFMREFGFPISIQEIDYSKCNQG